MLTWDAWRTWRACTRKQFWASEVLARNWLFLLGLRYPGDDEYSSLVPYRCDFCEGWHLGHPSPTLRT